MSENTIYLMHIYQPLHYQGRVLSQSYANTKLGDSIELLLFGVSTKFVEFAS